MSMEENQQTISECLQDVSVEYTTFGKRLRHIRKERGMTQEAFAELLGTSKQILSRYEREDRSPRIDVVRKYAEALKVSAESRHIWSSKTPAAWSRTMRFMQHCTTASP